MKLRVDEIEHVCGHHIFTDALFLQGYELLLESLGAGKTVLELCCGEGDLSAWLAARTGALVTGIDTAMTAVATATQKHKCIANVRFECESASSLTRFRDQTVDVIVGQAALHHLANDLVAVSRECHRVLKPGGLCIFIFEPLGHNPLIAAIRAASNARTQWIDESNLYLWAIDEFGRYFERQEVFYFSFMAYGCKALPAKAPLSKWLYRKLNGLDQAMFEKWPRLQKYAGNMNVCYWKR